MPKGSTNTSQPLTLDTISASLPTASPQARLGAYTTLSPETSLSSRPKGRQGWSIVTSLTLIIIFLGLTLVLVLRTRMMVLASNTETRETTLAKMYRGAITTVDSWLNYPGIATLQSSLS